jgi:hypothetical protein
MPFEVDGFPTEKHRRKFREEDLDKFFDGRIWCFDQKDEAEFSRTLDEIGRALERRVRFRGCAALTQRHGDLLYFRIGPPVSS